MHGLTITQSMCTIDKGSYYLHAAIYSSSLIVLVTDLRSWMLQNLAVRLLLTIMIDTMD